MEKIVACTNTLNLFLFIYILIQTNKCLYKKGVRYESAQYHYTGRAKYIIKI